MNLAVLLAWAFGIAAMTTLLVWAIYRPREPLQWRELLLPDELSAEQVQAALRHIAGVRQGPVLLTVQSHRGEVRFLLAGAARVVASLAAGLGGIAPELQLVEAKPPEEPAAPEADTATYGLSAGWSGPWPMLRTDSPELRAAGLLGALASARGGDELRLVVRLWPAGRVNRPTAASERRSMQANPWFMRLLWPAEPPREDVRAIRLKFSGLLLRTELVVVARAAGRESAAQLAQRVNAALRTAGGVRGVFRWRGLGSRKGVEKALGRRRPPLPWELSTLLSPEELVGIVGLPVEAPQIAGVSYGTAPRLMPPTWLPRKGRVFARSTWPGSLDRPLAQPVVGALQHATLVGPTGTGKSTLVAHLVAQDMAAGRGAFVMDLKGDLVNALLEQVPEQRRRDVVVFEPARGGPQPGLQLFPRGGDVELTADLLLGTLRELFADSWGIRSSQYLGLGLRTLAALPGATLLDLPWLFAGRRLRDQALAHTDDPWLHAAWERFDSLSPVDQAAQLSSPLTKLEELLGRSRLRVVLGQDRPRLDFSEVLARGRIVLVSLPPGLLGEPATRLLAALTLWQFFQAVEARAALPAAERWPFMAYVDEVAVLGNLPLPLDGLLERARGHGVGLTLSPQALSQLTQRLRASLLANVGSLAAFQQTSEEEASVLAKALTGVKPAQLQHLGQFEIAMRLSVEPGLVSPTMTGRTLPPGAPSSDAAVLRRASAERYGQSAKAVDAAFARRHGVARRTGKESMDVDSEPVLGVSRRRP